MKLDSKILVAVAMMLGAMVTTGCKSGDQPAQASSATPVAEQAAQSDAPATTDEATTVLASSTVRLAAPPALRVEVQGRAPSAHHVWQRGYWRYDSPRANYVWIPGYWEDTSVAAPFGPPAVRYEDPGYAPSADYCFVPGSWRWSGREYVWSYGHWTARRDVGFYYRPRYENVNGHWESRSDRWDADRAAAWEHDHRDQGHSGQGHSDQGHADQGHNGQGHSDQGHTDQGHNGQGHPAQGHDGNEGQGHAGQGQGHPAPDHAGQGRVVAVQPAVKTAAVAAQHPVATHRAPVTVVRQTPSATPIRRGHG